MKIEGKTVVSDEGAISLPAAWHILNLYGGTFPRSGEVRVLEGYDNNIPAKRNWVTCNEGIQIGCEWIPRSEVDSIREAVEARYRRRPAGQAGGVLR